MGAAAIPWLIGATVASGAYTAYQQKKAGQVANAEARIAANREGDAARGREIERRRALLRSLASQNAGAGAAGVDPNMIIAGADIQYAADDLLTDTGNTRSEQARLRLQGQNAKRAGTAGAFTTLLDTATAAGTLYEMKPKKKPGG